MIYDLNVILKYCEGDLPMTSWSSVGGLGRSRILCWRSCATLGAYVGGLGPLLGPAWAVLATLGAFVGSLVPLLVHP